MTDIPRTLAELQSLFANNITGLISPQDERDFIVSVYPSFASTDRHNFAAQTPGATLVSATPATITLTPVPAGVNGADSYHYLYISGGTGTAEAVLITGGTAVSGAASGTVTFTPANNHTGAWTIQSASSGIHEAMIANPYKMVILPPLLIPVYHEIKVPLISPGIAGQGLSLSIIVPTGFTATSVFTLQSGHTSFFVRDLSITPAANMTAGALLDGTFNGYMDIENVGLGGAGGSAGAWIGVLIGSGTFSIHGCCTIVTNYRAVQGSACYPQISGLQVIGNRAAGVVPPVGSCGIYLTLTAGGFIADYLQANGTLERGLYIDTTGAYCNEIGVNNFYVDTVTLAGIEVIGTGDAAHWEITNFRYNDTNSVFGSGGAAVGIRTNTGCINWQISNGNLGFENLGILIVGGREISVNNVMCFPVTAFGGAGGTGGAVVGGTHISFTGCYFGDSFNITLAGNAFVVLTGTTDYLTLVGNTFIATNQPQRLVFTGTVTHGKIANNNGISNAAKSVAAAATLTFPVMDDQDVIEITGSTALATAVAGLREGQKITMVWTDAAPGAVSQVATIASPGFTPTRYKPYHSMFTGGKLYIG